MRFNRLINMIGEDRFTKLQETKIAIFGLGGVGSYTAEIIARSGIKKICVIDYDVIDETNINRQLIALDSTVGLKKVDVFKTRALDINPNIEVLTYKVKADKDNIKEILGSNYDYVIDCIDDVNAKVEIAKYCLDHNIKFISSMGFANKFKPELIRIAKMNQTSVCPLAKAIRKQLKLDGYSLDFFVAYSEEKPALLKDKKVLSSNAYCPSVAGIYLATYVINKVIGE
ncbi:MAG: tRNA threonylcarbamoyladenosine dehydratase [Candidatus Izemoplasmatales bacterium]